MSNTSEAHEPTVYQIRIGGRLGEQWEAWFAHMTLTLADNGDTLLTGSLVDQAALHGVLRKVRDLGLPLISVLQIQPEQADRPDVSE